MSISGWSMGLMRIRLAMVCHRRWLVVEGGGGMGASWLGETGGGTCPLRFPLPFAMPSPLADSVSGSTPATQDGDPL